MPYNWPIYFYPPNERRKRNANLRMCFREDLSGRVQAIEGGIIQTGKWTVRIEGVGIPPELEATWLAVDFRTQQVFTVDSITRRYKGNERIFSVLCFDSDIAFSLFNQGTRIVFGMDTLVTWEQDAQILWRE